MGIYPTFSLHVHPFSRGCRYDEEKHVYYTAPWKISGGVRSLLRLHSIFLNTNTVFICPVEIGGERCKAKS